MSGVVEDSIHQAVRGVVDRDGQAIQRVLTNEARINRMELEIDNIAYTLLALQQPMAIDLRFITVAIKINRDLERMGDISVNLAERAQALMQGMSRSPAIDIPRMARMAQKMIRDSLDAFVRKDAELARNVLLSDDAVDGLRDETYAALIRFMEVDRRNIALGITYIFVARSLERLADHATNIAEDVLFLVQGVDVRHHASAGN